MKVERRGDVPSGPAWTFLTHHGQMLLAVAQRPDARVRDLAEQVGVSPRAAVSLLGDLVGAGYVERRREGRRNVYAVHAELPFRHPAHSDHAVGELMAVFGVHGLRDRA